MTVRLRLTLLYGGLFLLAGAGLLAVNYALVRSQFTLPFESRVEAPGPAGQLPDVIRDAPAVLIVQAGPVAGEFVTRAPSPAALEAVRRQLQAAALNQLLTQSGIALALMALASVGLGWLVAGRLLRPLDAALETQRRFVANASHELRTPLAIARTEVDVALADPDAGPAELRAMAERVRDASERSERLIEGLLTLARSERQLRTSEPVDLAVAAADALDAVDPEAVRLRLRVGSVTGAAPTSGDRVLLERLVANLVENAVRHNQPGGWLEVDTGLAGANAVVRVANGGRPIPPDQVTALFEPFRRLDGDRTGSSRGAGLGLSIVKAVATAHGGHAEARPLDGGGLEVTVRLPAPRPSTGTSACR